MSGIYLSFTSSEMENYRGDLFNTLQKAGQQVFPSNISYSESFFSHINQEIYNSSSSVHILGKEYGKSMPGQNLSVSEYQLEIALQRNEKDPSFKLFIWFPFAFSELTDEKQKIFISSIRNNIRDGVFFSNTSSPIQLVDDLRISIQPEMKSSYNVNPTEVFLIYNQLDDNEALEVIDMLSDILPVEKLNIIQDSDLDYSEFCSQQISKSKLAVVYFKESADWALPFTQQIWKKVGGASSHTPILLIGDEDPESNSNKTFKAPKVVSMIVSGQLIPLEIKVQYDKVLERV
ncbi:MAG: hypothetical protein ACK5D5_12640 [Bacteroidota bacterium]